MKLRLITAALLTVAATAAAQTSVYERIGNTTFGPDGRTYNRIGNSIYGSDGTTINRIGDSAYTNDGRVYNRIGDGIYGSDGSSARRLDSGTTILQTPSGRSGTCRTVGFYTFCD